MKQLWLESAVLGAALIAAPVVLHAEGPKTLARCSMKPIAQAVMASKAKEMAHLENGYCIRRLPISDLTQIQKNNGGRFPSKKLFDIIDGRRDVAAHGPRDMPVWGKNL